MWNIFLLLTGFVMLLKGADALVDGSASLARKIKISELVIGMTIVAFGTSAPELFVNLLASSNNASDLAIGNIVGSNIANTLLILGVSAMVFPLKIGKGTVWREIPFVLLATVVLAILANDVVLNQSSGDILTKGDGLVLLCFFAIFLHYTFGIAKNGNSPVVEAVEEHHYTYTKSFIFIILGLVGLTLGGKFIVDSSTEIAKWFGLSEALIGLTIVALGTSLPELATSVTAAYKKNAHIAVGNVVGSNIFNIFWILGASTLISPIPFARALNFDIGVTMAASIALFLWMFIGQKQVLDRWQGFIFIFCYIAYVGLVIARG